jgi:aminomethyltransferase
MTKQTVLYDAHVDLGADMTDFGGYEMPVRYKNSSIIDEHMAVREKVGMFDVSHMGRYWVTGGDAKEFLDILVPRDLMKLSPGMGGYTFMLNEIGGFKDDVIISQLDEEEFMVVCNAGNRDKIWNWMGSLSLMFRSAGKDVILEDKSEISSMIAVQGPLAMNTIAEFTDVELPQKRFRLKWISMLGYNVLLSTTGYTGEAGAELILMADLETIKEKSISLWNALLDKGVVPCALGSRDTLRLEAGYPLYGNDIGENMHLLESSLDFYPFASIDKQHEYIGQHAVLARRGKITHVRVGFKLLDRGIARHGYPVIIDGKEQGEVTSGTQSPLTKEFIGMAMVPLNYKEPGSKFQVDVRGKLKHAEVITLPAYDTEKYGATRKQ